MPTLAEFRKKPSHQEWRSDRRHPPESTSHGWFSNVGSEQHELSRAWKNDQSKNEVDFFSSRCAPPKENQCDSYYPKESPGGMAENFAFHASKWRRDTKHFSSVTKIVMHPSYLRIIGMGLKAIPLILEELTKRKDHWLIALNAISGEDPAVSGSTFQQAVDAWISWGKSKGYLR
jgi:hypothetical protein